MAPTQAQPYTAQQTATILDFISNPALLQSSFSGPTWNRSLQFFRR